MGGEDLVEGSPVREVDGDGFGNAADSPRVESRSGSLSEEASFVEWLGRYAVGKVGPADRTPDPPASVLSILNEKEPARSFSSPASSSSSDTRPATTTSASTTDSLGLSTLPSSRARRGPISLSITLSQGSSQASSATSNGSTSSSSLANPAVTDETAAALLENFRERGTFPAPPGPYEEERLRLAHKYGLDQPIRRKAIDRICAIAKAHFKTKMVVVSLTLDDHQVLGAERGFDPDREPTLADPPRPLAIEPAFCTHAMAASHKDPSQVFIVADANKDWRFSRNPYATKNGGGVSFYAAANVNLPVGDLADKCGLPATLASGALCLMDGTKTLRDPSEFSQEDRAVLSDLAEMIAREFQLGFEQRRREEETRQTEFLGAFLQSALVQPAQPGCLRGASSDPSSRAASIRSSPLNSLDREEGDPRRSINEDQPFHFPSTPSTPHLSAERGFSPTTPAPMSPVTRTSNVAAQHSPRNGSKHDTDLPLGPSLFTTAASNLISLTRAQSCGILDLRAFRSSHYQPRSHVLRSSVSLSPTQGYSLVPPFPSPSDLTTKAPMDRTDSTANADSRMPRRRTESYGIGPGPERRGRIGLMASEGAVEWRKIVRKSAKHERRQAERAEAGEDERGSEEGEDALTLAVEETLRVHASMSSEDTELYGLEGAFAGLSILPEATSDTCCVPIFDVDGSPALMIVLSSTEKWFRFEPSDRRFIKSVGAVLVGSLLRERARESDRAKLAFIGQVSHEVRTPLYGVSSQLSLIREFSSPVELRKLAPLLDVAEICVDSLSSVLEDTLDFSKLSNSSVQEEATIRQRRLDRANLVELVEGVLKSTWVKKRRADLVSVDLGHLLEAISPEEEKLDLILEVEGKEDGWEVLTDVGGLRRVLLNVIGNALKFTKSGHVKVTIRYLGQTSASPQDVATPRPRRVSLDPPSYRGYVAIVVEDTGIGMSQEFLRDGGLFTPFKQADSFASGVGLGLSICDSIVKRLGPGRIDVSSEVGVGTEISVTLPIDFVCSQTNASSFPFEFTAANRPRTSSRRIISDELNNLFGDPSNLLPATPVAVPIPTFTSTSTPSQAHPTSPAANGSIAQPPQVDFPSAVAAFHTTLSPTPEAEANSGPDELTIEAAKLAIASSQEVQSSIIPMSSPSAAGSFDALEAKGQGQTAAAPPATAISRPKTVAPTLGPQSKVSIAPDVHVLFADDNPVARNILIKLFTGKGIKFSAAEDGQEAVELFEAAQGQISLALLDIQMPRLDGIGAAHAIRALELEHNWGRIRIVALTGLSNETDIAEAVQGGVDKWLVKGGKSLRAILDEVVDVQREVEARMAEGAQEKP